MTYAVLNLSRNFYSFVFNNLNILTMYLICILAVSACALICNMLVHLGDLCKQKFLVASQLMKRGWYVVFSSNVDHLA